MSDAWYLDAEAYYVPAEDAAAYPMRQGDLIAGPHVGGEAWHAAQVLHPTCELGKGSLRQVQVARVWPLSAAPDDSMRRLIVAGFNEAQGERRVALTHTFFLPPWQEAGEPCFCNFREIASIPREEVDVSRRLAAITHDCRVTFIRRWTFFRFRLAFSVEQVRAWEAARIAGDPAFPGPRPGRPPGARRPPGGRTRRRVSSTALMRIGARSAPR